MSQPNFTLALCPTISILRFRRQLILDQAQPLHRLVSYRLWFSSLLEDHEQSEASAHDFGLFALSPVPTPAPGIRWPLRSICCKATGIADRQHLPEIALVQSCTNISGVVDSTGSSLPTGKPLDQIGGGEEKRPLYPKSSRTGLDLHMLIWKTVAM